MRARNVYDGEGQRGPVDGHATEEREGVEDRGVADDESQEAEEEAQEQDEDDDDGETGVF